LEKTLADAVSGCQDITLPPEHMPIDDPNFLLEQEKMKKGAVAKDADLAMQAPAAGTPPSLTAESCGDVEGMEGGEVDRGSHGDANAELTDDDNEDLAPLGTVPHHTWSFLTCDEVQMWANASRKQARTFYREAVSANYRMPNSWNFLRETSDFKELEKLAAEADARWGGDEDRSALEGGTSSVYDVSEICGLSEVHVVDAPPHEFLEHSVSPAEDHAEEGHADVAGEEDLEVEVAEESLEAADAGRPQCPTPSFTGPPAAHGRNLDGVLALQSSMQVTGWPITLKTTLRKLAEQVPGMPPMSHPHPRWPHTTLLDSFSASACCKSHFALFEEGAAAALLQLHREMTEGTLVVDHALTEPEDGTYRSLRRLASRLVSQSE